VELPRYKNEERQDYVLCRTAEGLLELAQLGVAEIHTFGSRYPRVDRADRLTFDLDPDPDLPWTQVRDAALTVRELLDRIGFESFVKTTGGKGLHVVAPLRAPLPDWDLAKRFTRAVSEYLAQSAPGVFVAKAGERNRVGRIFVDYLRNGYGATTVAAFSPRWRPGVRISVPLRWGELSRAQSMPVMGLREAARALARWRADPWRGYAEVRQTLRETAIARIAPQRPARRAAARKSATSADRIASSPPP
jgi:bifunctional non-homologous end joining protein LigD